MTVEALRTGLVAEAIRLRRLLVVLPRMTPRDELPGLVARLADAGVRVFEITLEAHTAEADLAAVRTRLDGRADGPFLVGAGTVLRRGELEAARRAGADFAAASVMDPALISTAVEEGLPFIPGALTPTEIAAAWAAGATFVKVFPACAVGPGFVRQLRLLMPEVQLIPAGGIDAASAPAFLGAGAPAMAIGDALVAADADGRRAIVEAVGR